MNIRISAILFALLLIITACEESPKESAADQATLSKPLQTQLQHSTAPAQPTITPAPSQPQPKTTSQSLGITVDDGKIIIDTKQTKDFLRGIGEKMKKSFQKIETSLQKEKIQSPDETGIIITDTKMQIDLNKTRNFMEKWMRSMESVVQELNKTMGEIQRSLPQR